MKVILKENVKALGNIGEVVNVSAGFARNFLVPRKLALISTTAGAKAATDHQKMLGKKIQVAKTAAQEVQKKLQAVSMVLIRKVGANGKLFGSITTVELAEDLAKLGFQVDRRQISLDRPIKQLGQYEARVKIFTDVEAVFNIKVEIDPVQAEELKKQQLEAAERKKRDAKANKEAAAKAKKEEEEAAAKATEEE